MAPASEAFTEKSSTPLTRFALILCLNAHYFASLHFRKATEKAGAHFFASEIGLLPLGKETKSPCSCDRLRAVGDFEFAEDVRNMMLNCVGCNRQCFRNVLVGGAACKQV
ncbi:hypothetical protein Krac_3603 [Ktedonobacter racemifer DSM 44963]|uniref:Uncharacterized protein n=1 Tax=Ktedonobacter racemifer DSM 44963 TaxID=485913 RepID=D6U287_KTERA|nr:hypothetical protein Krac_3603 [Ktedonobacter racemifer DSM 44963]